MSAIPEINSSAIQDIKKEELIEEEVFMQENHKLIKKWFAEKPELKQQYGRFPSFWQELKTWEHWIVVKKLYIQDHEKDEKSKLRKEYRKTRWSTISTTKPKTYWQQDEKKPDPSIVTAVSNNIISLEQLQICVFRIRMEEITDRIDKVEEEADRISKREDRSPSPPPTYDIYGTRTNTRAIRMRKRLEEERTQIMNEIVKLNPQLRALVPKQKFQRKVFIPFQKYQNQNLLSLVIGPRGNTQKELEAQYHVKIEARGKGIIQNSKKRAENQVISDEEGHFLITGENEREVEECQHFIQLLMDPNSEVSIIHKQKQLRELALINGKEETTLYCTICGQQGHQMYDCPNKGPTFKAADIRCKYCGETTHISSDCPHRNDDSTVKEAVKIQVQYDNFINELSGGDSTAATTTTNKTDTIKTTQTQPQSNPYYYPPVAPVYPSSYSNPYAAYQPLTSSTVTPSTGLPTPTTSTATTSPVPAPIPSSAPVPPMAPAPYPWMQPGMPYMQPGMPYMQPGMPYMQPGMYPYMQPGMPYTQPPQTTTPPSK